MGWAEKATRGKLPESDFKEARERATQQRAQRVKLELETAWGHQRPAGAVWGRDSPLG